MYDNLFRTESGETIEKRANESNQSSTNLINIFDLITKDLNKIFGLKEQIKYISEYRRNYEVGPFIPESTKKEYIGLREDFKRALKKMKNNLADFIRESNADISGLEKLSELEYSYAIKSKKIRNATLSAASMSIAEYKSVSTELEWEEEQLLIDIYSVAREMAAKAKSILGEQSKSKQNETLVAERPNVSIQTR